MPLLWIVLDLVGFCLLIGAGRALLSEARILRHWSQLVDGLEYSSEEFYLSLKKALRARSIPGASMKELGISQGAAVVSAKRLYLRVRRSEEDVYVCAAPFGRGFFFSSWLIRPPSVLRLTPIVGWILQSFTPPTYYRLDTEAMFHAAVHSAVLEVIDGLTSAKGIRALTESERKPIMRGFGA